MFPRECLLRMRLALVTVDHPQDPVNVGVKSPYYWSIYWIEFLTLSKFPQFRQLSSYPILCFLSGAIKDTHQSGIISPNYLVEELCWRTAGGQSKFFEGPSHRLTDFLKCLSRSLAIRLSSNWKCHAIQWTYKNQPKIVTYSKRRILQKMIQSVKDKLYLWFERI